MSRIKRFKDFDFVEAVLLCDGSTTSNIAEIVGCNHRTALVRLKDIESKKMIIGKKRGSVWFWYSDSSYTNEDFYLDKILETIVSGE